MKLKLFNFWKEFVNLIQGKRDFIYGLSFITCAFIIVMGIVILFMSSSLITIFIAVFAILVSLVGVIASIIPNPKIMRVVDCISIFVLFYAGFKIIHGYGQAQLAYAFYISIMLLYIWRFAVEGLRGDSNATRDSKVVK